MHLSSSLHLLLAQQCRLAFFIVTHLNQWGSVYWFCGVCVPYFANSSIADNFQHQLFITLLLFLSNLLIFNSLFHQLKNVNVKFYMKFYTLDLVTTLLINSHDCKHAQWQLLAEHKYFCIEFQICVHACIDVHTGEEWLSISLVCQQKGLQKYVSMSLYWGQAQCNDV